MKVGRLFAVYGRNRARPAFRIVKSPKPARPERRYSVTAGGRILDCGGVLGQVLRVFDRAHLRLVAAD